MRDFVIAAITIACVGLFIAVVLYLGRDKPAIETEVELSWTYPEGEEDPDGFRIFMFELVDVVSIRPGSTRTANALIKEGRRTCFQISAFNANHSETEEVLQEGEFVCRGMVPVQGLEVVQ
jgi:hypothetical protein